MNLGTIILTIANEPSNACPYCNQVDANPGTHIAEGRCSATESELRLMAGDR